jgi:DNA-binding FadR family transcriptional regulator
LDVLTQPQDHPDSTLGGVSGGPTRKMKTAELVALQIESEIARNGWGQGTMVGSEAELAARFHISRPTMREAVRLLEYRNVAKARRGAGGGLVVDAPDPYVVAEVAALYLRFRHVNAEQIFQVRQALELTAVQAAAQNIDEASIVRIRQAVDYESGLEEGPGTDVQGRAGLHLLIAELSGNPALELFIRVAITVLTQRYAEGDHLCADIEADVLSGHRAIAEAVCSGDAALAHFRMQRHLEDFLASIRGLSELKEDHAVPAGDDGPITARSSQ